MGGSVGAYVAQVDRVLGAGQGLFPAWSGPVGVAGGEPSVPAPPPRSGTAVGVSGVGEDYRRSWRGVTGLDAQATDSAGRGSAEGQRGRVGATGVRERARSQAAAIAPAAGSPAGVRLLVWSMDERLAAMQREIDTTKTQNRLLATRLRQVAAAYRTAVGRAPMGGVAPMRGVAPMSGWLGSLGRISGLMPSLGGLSAGPGQRSASAALTGLFGRDGRPSGVAARAVAFAKTKLGLPYIWGASGPRAYDCSGLVQDSYRSVGISLPRTTYEQMGLGTTVARSDIREGDLVFSNFSGPGRPEHVQLAVSPTMVIEAPTPGGHVQFSSIPSGRIVVKRLA